MSGKRTRRGFLGTKVAAQGRYEPFKVTHQYDGTFQNPQWLG